MPLVAVMVNGNSTPEVSVDMAMPLRADDGSGNRQVVVWVSVSDVSQLSMFSAEGSPARTSAWLEAVLDWLGNGADCSSSSCVSLLRSLPVGWSSRTSPAFSVPTTERTWGSCSAPWPNSGMGSPTGCLTLSTSEWPSDAVVCSLSDVLETGDVPPKFFLSPRAATGILRRADRRGRALPGQLQTALEALAGDRTSPAERAT